MSGSLKHSQKRYNITDMNILFSGDMIIILILGESKQTTQPHRILVIFSVFKPVAGLISFAKNPVLYLGGEELLFYITTFTKKQIKCIMHMQILAHEFCQSYLRSIRHVS